MVQTLVVALQYTDDRTTFGSVVGSILQEVFLSYKNVLAVRSQWSQMWVWKACCIFVYYDICIFVYYDICIFT